MHGCTLFLGVCLCLSVCVLGGGSTPSPHVLTLYLQHFLSGCLTVFQVMKIINTSLQTGIFPDAFKTAVVKLLLKKKNLDGNALINFRPISNLPVISKVLEKIVSVQINSFLKENNILEKFQSG